MTTKTAQVVIGLAGLAMLVTIGAYVVLRFRDNSDEAESSSELLTKFREMRQEGHLNDEEYRTIRTDLEGKLSLHSSKKMAGHTAKPQRTNPSVSDPLP